jgi:hypothetical protein
MSLRKHMANVLFKINRFAEWRLPLCLVGQGLVLAIEINWLVSSLQTGLTAAIWL